MATTTELDLGIRFTFSFPVVAMPKRKSEGADGSEGAAKKVTPKKIPKLLKAKILLLLSEVEVPVDIATIKALLAEKYDYDPSAPENKNKVWKTLKELKSEYGFCHDLFHGGKDSVSYKTLTPEDLQKHADAMANKQPEEKFTCPYCDAVGEYCQIGETVPGEFPDSTETEYKCLNSCYRDFTVTVHGNKRIYKWSGFGYDERKEVTVGEEDVKPST